MTLLSFNKKTQSSSILSQYGCRVVDSIGHIFIVEMPCNAIGTVAADQRVKRIESEPMPRLAMDVTPGQINATDVYQGINLPHAFTGRGVAAGIFDNGFDFTHPAFIDSLGNSRACYYYDFCWQNDDGTTGHAITTPEEIAAYGHTHHANASLHGTHVMGIMAGNAVNGKYQGMAPEADIYAAHFNSWPEDFDNPDSMTSAVCVLGFKYIFDQAEKDGKPCVINFSSGESFTINHQRILEGESSFSTMAVLYSEDPGSARQGGELGLTERGEWATEFENVAFNLRDGEISDVVETQFGFHIIQLIEKRDNMVNCRHILLTAKVPIESLEKAQNQLDSVAQLIRNGDMTFEEACKKFSDDDSKSNGGYLTNAATGSNRLSLQDLQELEQSYSEYKNLAFVVSRLEVGEVSDPLPMTTNENNDAFRLVMVKSKTEAHQANLKDDYNLIQSWALNHKRQQAIIKWVKDKAAKAYIRLDDTYKNNDFYYDWNIQ